MGYLFVQYMLYLAMATYNELFLLWVAILLVGVATVLVTILWLRLNAFFGLLLAAIAVSLLTDLARLTSTLGMRVLSSADTSSHLL